jgi:hypothetical protein
VLKLQAETEPTLNAMGDQILGVEAISERATFVAQISAMQLAVK